MKQDVLKDSGLECRLQLEVENTSLLANIASLVCMAQDTVTSLMSDLSTFTVMK